MDLVFEKNTPNIKAEAILLLIESVCAGGAKNKQKAEPVTSTTQTPGKDGEKKSQSKDKYEDFVRKFYSFENPKFIGEYEEKKYPVRVLSFKEDRSAVYAVNFKNGKINPINSLADVTSLVKNCKDS